MPKNRNYHNNQMTPVTDCDGPVVQLRVYYMRIHDENTKLTLTMKFSNGYLLPFDEVERTYHDTSPSPFIYALNLNIRIGKGKVYLKGQQGWRLLDEYRLEMSYPGSIYGQHKLEEIASQGRSLKEYYNVQHCFLFGIRFGSRFKFPVPGKMRRSAIAIKMNIVIFCRNRNKHF